MPSSTPRKLQQGESISEGATIRTGADGHVYFRMIDAGFLAVRPNSQLHIEAYAWNSENPSKNRIRLFTDKGVVRSVTGKAGSAAHDRFRMNTPVAAIGVRGTDFTVSSREDVTHVAVQQGVVSVSPFGNGCEINALGPCSGELALDIGENMKNVALEVRNAQRPVPVPVEKVPDIRDVNTIKPDEHVSLKENPVQEDREKQVNIRAEQISNTATTSENAGFTGERAVWWGRWQGFVQPGEEGKSVASQLAPNRESGANTTVYTVFRSKDSNPVLPYGTVNFRLVESEAWVKSGNTLSMAQVMPVGLLSIDFTKSVFHTTLDVVESGNAHRLNATGEVSVKGFFRDNGKGATTIVGTTAAEGSQAGYAFTHDLDSQKELVGVTLWQKR
jgi:hypothetical protein